MKAKQVCFIGQLIMICLGSGFTQTITTRPVVADQQYIIHENCSNGDDVGVVHLFPTDDVQGVIFTFVSGDISLFSINSSTGAIQVASAAGINYDTQTSHACSVRVQGTLREMVVDQTIEITIQVLNDTDIVFIDPDAATNGTGIISDPKNTYAGLNIQSNTCFLQKRGTTAYLNNGIWIHDVSTVLFGAYGQGNKPKVLANDNLGTRLKIFDISVNANAVTVRELEVAWDYGTDENFLSEVATAFDGSQLVDIPVCAVQVMSPSSATSGHRILYCDLHHVYSGVRILNDAYNFSEFKILYNHVYDIREDGLFGTHIHDMEIAYNIIERVNRNWDVDPDDVPGGLSPASEDVSGGDGIQFQVNMDNLYVHHNYIDRSNSGNKFAFIHTGEEADTYTVTFEDNYVIGPLKEGITRQGDPAWPACIYIHTGTHVVRNNIFIGGTVGVAVGGSYDKHNQIEGNVFTEQTTAITNRRGDIYNNVFFDVRKAIDPGLYAFIRNNIFQLNETGDVAIVAAPGVDSDYNCYSTEHTGMFSTLNSLAEFQAGGDDLNSFVGVPVYVDPAVYDFRLQAGSSGINSGTDASGIGRLSDYYQTDLPQSNGWDMGAFEYVPESCDLDCDGTVNVVDLQACVNHILGMQNWGSVADVSGDGEVNVVDVQMIVNQILWI